jgi:hypothetical protein
MKMWVRQNQKLARYQLWALVLGALTFGCKTILHVLRTGVDVPVAVGAFITISSTSFALFLRPLLVEVRSEGRTPT